MDYKVVGVYTNKKESTFNGGFLVNSNDNKYEIVEFPIKNPYRIMNNHILINGIKFPLKQNYVKIKMSNTFLFICYKNTLQIYDINGQFIREITSKTPIIPGCGGFIISDDNTRYILNNSAQIHFINDENIINFTEDGILLFVSNKNNQNIFTIKYSDKTILFDNDSDLLLSFQGYEIFKNKARIENPIASSSIKLKTMNNESYINCVITVTKESIFVILDDLIIKKPSKDVYNKIVPERFAVHNYINECSVYDCIIISNLFKSTDLYKEDEVENLLVAFINSKKDWSLAETLVKNLLSNSNNIDSLKIICRAYRQVDDESKLFLDRFIPIESLNADYMFYIVIYKPELLSKFINLCKTQKRLFYLEDLRAFYDKTDRTNECKKIFLQSGILIYEYNGLEKMISIEKKQIESQRMEYYKLNGYCI